jgi:carbamate kinase
MKKRAVVAIGGNAITRPGQVGTIPEQFANAKQACRDLLVLLENDYNIVLTHGNGPQVGNILLRVELSAHQVYTLPLDTCVSDSQGGMGYMLQQVMYNVLAERGMDLTVATVLTQAVVDEDDPAFSAPSKPVGPFYTQERAGLLEKEKGWHVVEDAGRGYRRVVPSPIPREIVEIDAIRALLESDTLVIAAGGGGIPVVRKEGFLEGAEAVIDKDHASSLLARELDVDLFLIATSVEQVYLDYGKPNQRPLGRATVDEIESYIQEGQFPAGSMGPKMEASLEYLRNGGREVIITDIAAIARALKGETGTHIVP